MSSPYQNTVILQEEALNGLIGLVKNYPVGGSGTGILLTPIKHTIHSDDETEILDRIQFKNAIQIDSTLELGGQEFIDHPACLKITDNSVQSGDTIHPAVRYLQVGSLLAFSPENDATVGTAGTFAVHENNIQNKHIVRINGFNTSGQYQGAINTSSCIYGYGGLYCQNGISLASGVLSVSNTEEAQVTRSGGGSTGTVTAVTAGSIRTEGGIAAKLSIKGYKLYGAVFNDYAEYRQSSTQESGRCVVEIGNGQLKLATERLMPGANIISDTFGFSIGETDTANTPIAVCGRVLAYPAEAKETYQAGDAVCSGPNGTISKMTREEIKEWPDRIVGYVSEIPTYEKWGSDNIEVNNRIWIKIK